MTTTKRQHTTRSTWHNADSTVEVQFTVAFDVVPGERGDYFTPSSDPYLEDHEFTVDAVTLYAPHAAALAPEDKGVVAEWDWMNGTLTASHAAHWKAVLEYEHEHDKEFQGLVDEACWDDLAQLDSRD